MSLELRLTSQRKHGSRDKSSASAGPPHLPQELIDLIIDHLAFDSDFLTLQSCSLAASSWLPRSRGHLFNAVSLEPDDFPQAETHFGHSAPHLAQFVRKLYIRTGATDEEEDEEPVPRDNELTPSLLALFTRVDSLHLVHMRWDDLRPSVRDYFHSGYLELSTLHLGDVEFSKSSHLLHFLRCLPRLTLLHLRRVTWCSKEEGHHHRGPEHSRLAHLREVRVYECTSSAVFICGLFCGGNGEALERIALDWGESENPDVLRRLILTAGESLQTLEVDVSWQESAVPLDLGRNCNLEELWLDGLLLEESDERPTGDIRWIPSLLSGIVSPRLRKVVFYLVLSHTDGLQRLDLEHMDDMLAQLPFRSVKIVGFLVTILPHSGFPPPRRPDIQAIIESRMPKLNSRGILSMSRADIMNDP